MQWRLEGLADPRMVANRDRASCLRQTAKSIFAILAWLGQGTKPIRFCVAKKGRFRDWLPVKRSEVQKVEAHGGHLRIAGPRRMQWRFCRKAKKPLQPFDQTVVDFHFERNEMG